MKCPACKKRLVLVNPVQTGEYICPDEDCPGNDEIGVYQEYYGTSQEEIDRSKY